MHAYLEVASVVEGVHAYFEVASVVEVGAAMHHNDLASVLLHVHHLEKVS